MNATWRFIFPVLLLFNQIFPLPPPQSIPSKNPDPMLKQLAKDFAKGKRVFSIQYRSVSGERFEGIPEWENRLSVNGKGEAALLRRRSQGDTHDPNPGLFAGQIPDSSLSRFLETLALNGAKGFAMDAPDPTQPVNILSITADNQTTSISWGFSTQPTPPSLQELEDILEAWVAEGCPLALWSLSLEADSIVYSHRKIKARLTIENRGKQVVALAKPGSFPFGSRFGIGLDYAPKRQIKAGYTPAPLEIRTVAMKVGRLPKPEYLNVANGKPIVLEFLATLEGEAPLGWVGKFSILHYLAADSIGTRPAFNGALFSEEFSW